MHVHDMHIIKKIKMNYLTGFIKHFSCVHSLFHPLFMCSSVNLGVVYVFIRVYAMFIRVFTNEVVSIK